MEKKIVFSLAIICCVVSFALAVSPTDRKLKLYVSGSSMEPLLTDGETILATKVRSPSELPGNYPVCIFYGESDAVLVKRLIGYPGDEVELSDGATYVNGSCIMDQTSNSWDNMKFHVPDDGYLFLGDNRGASADARHWAETYVPGSAIIGYIPDSGLEVNK